MNIVVAVELEDVTNLIDLLLALGGHTIRHDLHVSAVVTGEGDVDVVLAIAMLKLEDVAIDGQLARVQEPALARSDNCSVSGGCRCSYRLCGSSNRSGKHECAHTPDTDFLQHAHRYFLIFSVSAVFLQI